MERDTPPINTNGQYLNRTATAQHKHRVRTILNIVIIGLDAVLLALAFVVGYWARLNLPFFAIPPETALYPSLADYAGVMGVHMLIVIIMFYSQRLYHQARMTSRLDQIRLIVGVVTIGSLLALGLQEFFFKNTLFEVDYSRSLFFYVWVFSMILVTLGREFYRQVYTLLYRRGIGRANLLIVGTGRLARDIMQKTRNRPELGYELVGLVHEGDKAKDKIRNVPILGTYPDLPRIIDEYGVEQVIIALPEAKRAELVELITLCQRGEVDIKVYPDLFAYMAGDLNVHDLAGTPMLTVRDIALRGWKLSLKRSLDFFGAAFGLIFLSPLMLLTAVLIRLESSGPVFYSQVRMSLDGKPLNIIKFRSMFVDAEAEGVGWTVENDPRVTRVGRFMRRTSWDEIPNLINVLFGQMSLVGPRPERPVYVQEFRKQIPRYMERHREKGGMTGWAQINGLRGDTSIAERTTYDVWYVENWSLWLDIKIILRTFMLIILRKDPNAY